MPSLWIDILDNYADSLIEQRKPLGSQQLVLSNDAFNELKDFCQKRDKLLLDEYGSDDYPIYPLLLTENPVFKYSGFDFFIVVK